jgi:ribosomal protein S18 acetylase RimI-like enzyme
MHEPVLDPSPVVELTQGGLADVVDVLVEAFGDYPTLHHIVGATGDAFAERLRTLLGFFVQARRVRGEPVVGVRDGDRLVAVALASLPDAATPPGALDAARGAVWAELGAAAHARYEALGRVWQDLGPAEPHVHLHLLGVRRSHRRAGLGRLLLERVQRSSDEHPTSIGVTLNTEVETNVAYYRRLGYGVVGEALAAPALRTWVLRRLDDATTR